MVVFVILLLVPLVIQHIAIKGSSMDYEKRNRIAITAFFWMLTLLLMLRRESVGNDTRNYHYYFNVISRLSWSSLDSVGLDMGFVVLNKLISVFTQDSQVYLAVVAVLTTAMILPTYKRLSQDAGLTVVVFCILSTFVMMFSGIRQMLAIGIGFIAYEFTRKKKIVPYLISVMAAILFHTSAFMLIFMYPLFHAKITKKWLYAVIPLMLLVFVYNQPIFALLGLFLERYTEFSGTIESTGAYMMIILFVLFAVLAYLIPDESKLDAETIGLRNFLLLTIVVQMFAPLNTIAMRMGYYYIIFIPLLLPKIIACKSDRWSQIAVLARNVMVVFFFAYFFYNALSSDTVLHVFPYHFFWESIG